MESKWRSVVVVVMAAMGGLVAAFAAYSIPQGSTGQVLSEYPTPTTTVTQTVATTATVTATRTLRRTVTVSRSTSRKPLSVSANQVIARELLAQRGWSGQWTCLNSLVNRESGWNVYARNPRSSAYGIPQALPAGKMASAGADWRTNPRTQLTWMLGYIATRYSTPCGAWAHSQRTGWY